jgi:hypothetical protein
MSRGYEIASGTGTGAISVSHTCQGSTQLISFFVALDTAPTSAGEVILTLDSHLGADYDTVVKSANPVGKTNVAWWPEHSLRFVKGDIITLTYTNPDARTFGASIYFDRGATS